MIFYLIWFTSHCYDGTHDLFWCRHAAFHGDIKIILVNSF
jgi:hypothetical protein